MPDIPTAAEPHRTTALRTLLDHPDDQLNLRCLARGLQEIASMPRTQRTFGQLDQIRLRLIDAVGELNRIHRGARRMEEVCIAANNLLTRMEDSPVSVFGTDLSAEMTHLRLAIDDLTRSQIEEASRDTNPF